MAEKQCHKKWKDEDIISARNAVKNKDMTIYIYKVAAIFHVQKKRTVNEVL